MSSKLRYGLVFLALYTTKANLKLLVATRIASPTILLPHQLRPTAWQEQNPQRRSRRRGSESQASNNPDNHGDSCLPAELRNEIYAMVCGQQTDVFFSARTNGRLVSSLPLLSLSRQIRDESHDILAVTAPQITATVRDVDFGPVIAFFNRCDDRQLSTLEGGTVDTADDQKREFIVEIQMRVNPIYFADRLRRRVSRFARPEKKGTAVQVVYRLGHGESMEHMDCLKEMVENLLGRRRRLPRQVDELRRLLQEIQRAQRVRCTNNPGTQFRVGAAWFTGAQYMSRI